MTSYKFNQYTFYLAVFLLPSAGFISGLLFLATLSSSFFKNWKSYLNDKWNISFLIASFFLLISSLSHLNNEIFLFNPDRQELISFFGLFNWIPFFLCFWGFQPYLNSNNQRKIISYCLIAGTFPVLISGAGQYWFNWTGPLQLFSGLIIWFQRPLDNNSGITAVFNNANYLGSWLSICWPISIILFLDKAKNSFHRFSSFIFSLSIATGIFLTESRNAFLAIFLSLPLLFGVSSSITWTIIIILILIFMYIIYPIFPIFLQSILTSAIPLNTLSKFEQIWNGDLRLDIWTNGLNFLFQKPLLGWGPEVFPILYTSKIEDIRHSHNLYLELAINYGLPSTIIIFGTIFIIYLKAFNLNFINKSGYLTKIERSWFISAFIFSLTQFFDIQYYDGRISLIFWILLAGLKAQLDEQKLASNL